ncbi:hypothetical protein HII31_06050 [Pseudocercospora fuligena]|uniref:RapZ C-terminal domain-containing protein n=1 Tax=Pseudocercospora fuligena TaxID=685502 RepID=A0A8H6RK30_9PEZI|nr:hypothetical protein HII31_06050 [Pseudocercospora fuligena]
MSARNLLIVSHARTPPLNPPGNLKYDLRSIPNPPKHIRDAYNGTSKRLREWMLAEPAFVTLVEQAIEEIEERMKDVDARSAADEGPATKEPETDDDEEANAPDLGSESVHSDDEVDSDEDEVDDEAEITNVPDLTVDVSCERGKHRSVAFAEELAGRKWKDWNVQVIHRDVKSKRKQDEKFKDKQKRRGGFLDEDD